MQRTTYVESPVGRLRLVGDDGALVSLHMEDQRHAAPHELVDDDGPAGFEAVVEQLAAYFAGELRAFDVVLAPRGTPFQQRVWAVLREIPFGQTMSYGEIALALGQPTASRAVGLANGRNPVGIIVPCHRVIGAGGKLVGYAGGLTRKQFLLEHERRHSEELLPFG
ncbi:methylated-DNA-[protein]-cysteine S-methyltransferase [Motilibacter rhizosphaerae]|uniref:Methylated-DNA--protein-cysteine methyltransferase n=1 Tax=Motilibacter rhizosphaerae TaxID=598652 RepID=A0A4V2F542_9ACTN|nr:methylated-DNA--[protein]-cysteine S-methyltransferase [Motilibacter rhizosphaerae]RZS91509.1 methylated-DNA-[protein]-cysteine S-methyltransferase [Motilibacter rhizosphaerae]